MATGQETGKQKTTGKTGTRPRRSRQAADVLPALTNNKADFDLLQQIAPGGSFIFV
jgi:hypothetical protein